MYLRLALNLSCLSPPSKCCDQYLCGYQHTQFVLFVSTLLFSYISHFSKNKRDMKQRLITDPEKGESWKSSVNRKGHLYGFLGLGRSWVKTFCAWKMWARSKAQAWIMLSWNQENFSYTKPSSCLSVSQSFESPSRCPPLSILLLVVEADLLAPFIQCFMSPTGAPRGPLFLPPSHRHTSSALCSP